MIGSNMDLNLIYSRCSHMSSPFVLQELHLDFYNVPFEEFYRRVLMFSV